ncbi:lysine exporter LysO family protein [Paradesulfitobacterium ferrireducens]|uniref:lysine exporter LysO family protein n=1 Tax=Paradesulfitobacterium ferrireducens TaxID=2816476 RepID=UPI001A8C5C79|nr:LysO family transporter [Paradesulfitobacterium ferrireducens]
MWILLGCLAAGTVIGWRRWLPAKVMALSGKAMMLGVMFLLISMGIRLGSDRETLNQLGIFGLQALVFAAGTVGASISLVISLEFLQKKLRTIRVEEDNHAWQHKQNQNHKKSEAHPYRMTALILGAFALGVALGSLVIPDINQQSVSLVTTSALNITLLSAGIDLGLNKEVWQQIMRLGWQVFLAPAGVAVGSIAAGMIIGKILGWSWYEGGAVGAGFGWYSLSGVLITQIHSVSLGTIAFLSNVARELLAILLIPWLSRRVGMLALVAPGGATTMDTTLPLLAAVGPPGVAVVALVNGISLSALVPVIVPLFLS